MFRAISAAAFFAVGCTHALAGISDDLKFCANLASGKERLACYDAAARIEKQVPAASTLARSSTPLNAHAAIPTRAGKAQPASKRWEGFFVGAHGAYQFDGNSNYQYNGFAAQPVARRGWLAGAQVGYNFQVDRMIFGAVLDGAYSDVSASNRFDSPFSAIPLLLTKGSMEAFGTARLKLGFEVGPAWVYGTGGLAWAVGRNQVSQSVRLVGQIDPIWQNADNRGFHVGYVAGFGSEARINNSWTVFSEYLYSDFEARPYARTFLSSPITNSHIVKFGINYWLK